MPHGNHVARIDPSINDKVGEAVVHAAHVGAHDVGAMRRLERAELRLPSIWVVLNYDRSDKLLF